MEQRDFFEEYVNDVAQGLCGFEYRDGTEFNGDITKEQVEKIAQKFRHDRDVSHLFENIDGICTEYIMKELGLQ